MKKSFINSKVVDFSGESYSGPAVHHFGFASKDDITAIEAMEALIDAGVISNQDPSPTYLESGELEGFIFSWYTDFPITARAADIGKIRRRAEDALRKSDDRLIIRIAGILGVKIS